MYYSKEILAFGPSDLFDNIVTDNQPDVHEMLRGGVVPNTVVPAGSFNGMTACSDIGSRVNDIFDALNNYKSISRASFATPDKVGSAETAPTLTEPQ